MTLRVIRSAVGGNGLASNFAISQTEPDSWVIRALKLTPGESMVLFGVGSAVLSANPGSGAVATLLLSLSCLLLTSLVRYRATRDVLTGKVQWLGILIATLSIVLWILALELPNYLAPEFRYYPGLVAILWIALVPLYYKGNPS